MGGRQGSGGPRAVSGEPCLPTPSLSALRQLRQGPDRSLPRGAAPVGDCDSPPRRMNRCQSASVLAGGESENPVGESLKNPSRSCDPSMTNWALVPRPTRCKPSHGRLSLTNSVRVSPRGKRTLAVGPRVQSRTGLQKMVVRPRRVHNTTRSKC